MVKHRALLGLVMMVLVVGLTGSAVEGCLPSQLIAIDESTLTDQDKAAAKLYVAETAWVEAKEVMANILTDLAFSGVVLGSDQKTRIKESLAAGNAALADLRALVELGDVSAASAFAITLRTLQTQTRSLATATEGLR